MSTKEALQQSRLLRGVHRTLTGLHPALESVIAALVGLLAGAILMAVWRKEAEEQCPGPLRSGLAVRQRRLASVLPG